MIGKTISEFTAARNDIVSICSTYCGSRRVLVNDVVVFISQVLVQTSLEFEAGEKNGSSDRPVWSVFSTVVSPWLRHKAIDYTEPVKRTRDFSKVNIRAEENWVRKI